MVKHPCGCTNDVDEASGVTKCLSKCDDHVTWALTHPSGTLQNYIDMGCLLNGIPQNWRYIQQLTEALDDLGELEFVEEGHGKCVLEIGCGLGMYVPMFLMGGWNYSAVETSPIAAYWVRHTFAQPVNQQPYESLVISQQECILAAHVLEHFKDAPAALTRMWHHLDYTGKLILIVPDDSDQTNPDHWWFFTEDSLHRELISCGFSDIRMLTRKQVAHENFIYAIASKEQRSNHASEIGHPAIPDSNPKSH